ncbi:MAG: hypothetical protein HRU69_08155 [Flammeovirgaceae bacterium]|nr:MAG: hypothetical protein HRU69_08155 [Flammeovirgaceae bacterium]
MANEGKEGSAEKAFKNFGKKVDQFMAELNVAGEKLNKEFEQKFEELKLSAEKLKKEAQDKERWKEVEASLKKAGQELENALKAAFKKKTSG